MNDKINYRSAQYILGSIGTLGGLYYAFKGKKGFWGFAGFAILGGIAGSIIGGLYDNTMKPTIVPQKATPSENDVKNDLVGVKPTTPVEQTSMDDMQFAGGLSDIGIM
jgi:hypothetical protein